MNAEDVQRFKELFRTYCRQERNAGHCDDDDCELCSVNRAYEEIFDNVATE